VGDRKPTSRSDATDRVRLPRAADVQLNAANDGIELVVASGRVLGAVRDRLERHRAGAARRAALTGDGRTTKPLRVGKA
jgi:hypothetical protein